MSPWPICAVEFWVSGESSTGGVAFGTTKYIKYPSGESWPFLQKGILNYFAGTKTHLAISFGVKPCTPGLFVLLNSGSRGNRQLAAMRSDLRNMANIHQVHLDLFLQNGILHYFAATSTHFESAFGVNHVPSAPFLLLNSGSRGNC